MPVYEFECRDCGPFTELRSLDRSSLPANCPACGEVSPKVFSIINLRAMRPENRTAHDRNERSAHAPHVCGSGCSHTHSQPKSRAKNCNMSKTDWALLAATIARAFRPRCTAFPPCEIAEAKSSA